MCACVVQGEREKESDIGAADLNIEHARNITRRNLTAKIERRKEKERTL